MEALRVVACVWGVGIRTRVGFLVGCGGLGYAVDADSGPFRAEVSFDGVFVMGVVGVVSVRCVDGLWAVLTLDADRLSAVSMRVGTPLAIVASICVLGLCHFRAIQDNRITDYRFAGSTFGLLRDLARRNP